MNAEPLVSRRGVGAAMVGVVAAAVSLGSLWVPFLRWDDTIYITESARTRTPGLGGFLALFSTDDLWANRFLEFYPLRDVVYWVVFQAFGLNPVPFHVVNLVAHAVATALVLLVGRRLGLTPATALTGALVFAVHPMHVESVTWISGLKDPLFTSLMLGSVLCFLRYREDGRPLRYAATLLLLVAALLCKSIALCGPVLLLAIDRLVGSAPRWRVTLARVAPTGVIAAGFLVQTVLLGHAAHIVFPPHGGSWASNTFLAGWAFVRYVQQAALPISFTLHHCFRPPEGLGDVRLWLIIATALAVTLTAMVVARRRPLITLLLVWFFAALLPVANLVPFPAIMADRYLYLPSVASCLLIALALAALPVRARVLGSVGLVVTLAAVTVSRTVVWQHEDNLWAEVVSDPECLVDDQVASAAAFFNYGRSRADHREALAAYQAGIAHLGFSGMFPEQRCFLLGQASKESLALGEWSTAASFADRAARLCSWEAEWWRLLSSAAARTDPHLAADAAHRAYALAPDAASRWNLGDARLAIGDLGGADDLVAAVREAPARFCRPFTEWAVHAPPLVADRLAPGQAACARR